MEPSPDTAQAANRTYFGIQALRAVAALMVANHHAQASWRERIMNTPGGTLVWRNGESVVDIFFVISGFVMAITLPSLAKFENKGWVFLQRRLIRIVPMYWIFTTFRLLRLLVRAARRQPVHRQPVAHHRFLFVHPGGGWRRRGRSAAHDRLDAELRDAVLSPFRVVAGAGN